MANAEAERRSLRTFNLQYQRTFEFRFRVAIKVIVDANRNRPDRSRPWSFVVNPARFVMADQHRLVAARALGDAKRYQFRHRLRAPANAVSDDEPMRVRGADGLDRWFHRRRIDGSGNVAGFVDEVKAKLPARHTLIARREHAPVPGKLLLRRRFGPQRRLLAITHIDAVAGAAVEIDADVNAILFAPHHGLVNLLHGLLIKFRLRRFRPASAIHRQANEVESPAGNQLKILFHKWLVADTLKFLQQIKPAPARQLLWRGFRQRTGSIAIAAFCKGGHDCGGRTGFEKLAAIHDGNLAMLSVSMVVLVSPPSKSRRFCC